MGSTELTELVDMVRSNLSGLKPWGVRRGHGSALTMEFGPPEPKDPKHGQWHLWISYCDWCLTTDDGKTLDTREGLDVEAASELLEVIMGATLEGFQVLDNQAVLVFSNGWRLVTKPYEDGDDWPAEDTEQVLLFAPGNRVGSLLSNGDVVWETR